MSGHTASRNRNRSALIRADRGHSLIGRIVVVLAMGLLLASVAVLRWNVESHVAEATFYSLISLPFIYLIVKLFLSLLYKPAVGPTQGMEARASVIIPNYNESPAVVERFFRALLNQSVVVAEILFVDDGSTDPEAFHRIEKLSREINERRTNGENLPQVKAHRFTQNQGKRAALIWGAQASTGEFLVLADSDGVLDTQAIEQLLRPFADSRIGSVCGNIGLLNVRKNWLTRMQDLIYLSSFQLGRAAQSVTGSVIVCSGGLSAHRRAILTDNAEDFLSESFAGVNLSSGDDRALTSISLRSGYRTVFQSTAVCLTNGPETVEVFLRQQSRWMKSSFLYTTREIFTNWKQPIALLWMFFETFLWLVCGIIFIVATIVGPWSATLIGGGIALVYFVLIGYIQRIFYVFISPLLYLFSPLYFLIYGPMLFVIRITALLSIRKTRWDTR